MTNPFAYVPFAIAARGGMIDAVPASQLTMAGVTLLRASATLVRALHGGQSAILLRSGAAYLTALAASDGRAALLLDPAERAEVIARRLAVADVGAVFTVHAFAPLLPPGIAHVWLDQAPARATIVTDGAMREVSLTGHDALRLDGDAGEDGADEPCVLVGAHGTGAESAREAITHRTLLAQARAAARRLRAGDVVRPTAPFCQASGLVTGLLGPLLAGAHVRTVGAVLDVPVERRNDVPLEPGG